MLTKNRILNYTKTIITCQNVHYNCNWMIKPTFKDKRSKVTDKKKIEKSAMYSRQIQVCDLPDRCKISYNDISCNRPPLGHGTRDIGDHMQYSALPPRQCSGHWSMTLHNRRPPGIQCMHHSVLMLDRNSRHTVGHMVDIPVCKYSL